MVSATVAGIAASALELYPMDLIVFYTGHNDYTAIHGRILQTYFYPFPPWVDWLNRAALGKQADSPAKWNNHMKHIHNPTVTRWLLDYGVIQTDKTLNQRAGQKINARIFKVFQGIVDRAAGKRVPVAIIPPVSNLEIKPLSSEGAGEKAFAEGIRATNPQNRLALLIRARDEDIFNGIARAKSTLRSTFRKLTGDPLCHIDLEKRLLDAGFTFNDKNFLDAVHFTPQGHLSVAIALDSALREINFCQSARPKPKIQPQPMYMP